MPRGEKGTAYAAPGDIVDPRDFVTRKLRQLYNSNAAQDTCFQAGDWKGDYSLRLPYLNINPHFTLCLDLTFRIIYHGINGFSITPSVSSVSRFNVLGLGIGRPTNHDGRRRPSCPDSPWWPADLIAL